MSELREARARSGMSLEEASRRTRIPLKWLDALERGDHAAFPAGPFLAGYTRQYRAFLGLPERAPEPPPPPPRVEPEPPPPPRMKGLVPPEEELTEAVRRQPEETTEAILVRRNTPRLLAVGGLAALGLVLVGKLLAEAFPEAAATLGEEPDQVVSLALDDEMKVRVVADGRVVSDGPLGVTTATPHVFRAHDRLELDLPTLEGVRIRYNGEPLNPLGAQSRPRRLVFSDDPS